ncbi:CMGC/CLK protein kinase [Wolfiporia cocos MD-104 SS10]|uniref:CMGC/CLK protein kinase n=1 Tax=Wolfiporia cocos (strain MD-104) TaxID=742152 RepID=A0A2H3JZX3_WOLCO|nr:CMGC/CLK protein kinase [Wolfiporia cocos MD-104 SS10]
MQTAVYAMPPPLPSQFSQSAFNRSLNGNPNTLRTTLTTRKRKRPQQYTVSYSEVQEVDSTGKVRDVIVIEDTPPPSTISSANSPISPADSRMFTASYQPPVYAAPIRTRARAAAEAKGVAGTSSTVQTQTPLSKKRRRDPADDTGAVTKRPAHGMQYAVSAKKPYANGRGAPRQNQAALPKDAACDDKEGHYIVAPNDIIKARYRTIRLLGQGTFGKVVEAVDLQTQQRVAIKIIRAIPKYRDASKMEVRVMQTLQQRDPRNTHKCIHLLSWFDHRNHICLVSELLGMCVYDFLKENEFAPFPRQHIQSFARQLLGSVAFLHDNHLIHTDLKPENILLVKNDYRTVQVPVSGKTPSGRTRTSMKKRILESTDIRLIDFGSAIFAEEYHANVVSTRHYRAPEIILGLGWSYPCDAFSLGCILVEFYTGVALFQTHENLEHLAMMEKVMGKMPERFAEQGARSKPEFFTKEGGKLPSLLRVTDPQSRKDVKACRSLEQIIPPNDSINCQFLDLVKKLLTFDPTERISVKEALKHRYFSTHVPNEF